MTRTSSLRRGAPVLAVALVAGAVALPAALADDQPGDLAPRSAAELLVDLAEQDTTALSGTVVLTSRLGLPELPGAATGTGPLSLASGSSTLRVWADGPDRTRVALLGELAEYDVVRDGREVWTYSSELDEAVRYLLPELPARPEATAVPGAPTPQEAAEAVLAAVSPTTEVSVDEAVRVAGRDARQLVLTPADPGSLVGSVRLAVDDETSAPLRVQVFATADAVEPAFEVGFTDVSFEVPDASVFDFSAPPGSTVREVTVPELPTGDRPARPDPAALEGLSVPQVLGEGWASVLVLEVGELPEEQTAMLDALTTRVPEGRSLQTALLSVLLTDDGRVLVGSVPVQTLQDAA